MNAWHFLKEGLSHLKTIGTVTRSSQALCDKMADQIDFQQARLIVELGAGDGVITKTLLRRMRPDAQLIAFEILPNFVEQLQRIEDPRLIVAADSAERIGQAIGALGRQQADAIVSALPFVVIPEAQRGAILQACAEYLRPGGAFVQVNYSTGIRKVYAPFFGPMRIKFVLFNFPPAFVLVGQR